MRVAAIRFGLVAFAFAFAFAFACTPHATTRQTSSSPAPAPSPSPAPAFSGDAHRADTTATDAGTTATTTTDRALAPLDGFPTQLELLDGKEKLGVVSVPLGAREPRPIMIAIHGGSDRPERACSAWRGVTEAYAFVVCPRGFGGNERRLGWRTTPDTTARITRAIAATKKIFGTWVRDTESMVLTGFSMGGSQVAHLASADPKTYRRIVVGDSAHDPQPALKFAHTWVSGAAAASDRRAIFLCTTSGCEPALRAAARKVASEKATARLNIAPTRVHALSERAVESMRRDWPWLVEGAEGWEAYVPPNDPSQLPGKTEVFDPN